MTLNTVQLFPLSAMFVLLVMLLCGLSAPAPVTSTSPTRSECTLPSYPSHGKFTVTGPFKNLPPGTIVEEFTAITYSCDTNYDASTEMVVAHCEKGKWNIPPPICRKRCRMFEFPSVDFTCHNSRTVMVCPKFLPYGSVITPTCKSGHINPDHDIEDMTCVEDGRWNNTVPYCRTDCGLEKPISEVQIVRSKTLKKYTFPWHVGIYQWDETTNTTEQICGGSIIRSNIIISAAHCFWDSVKLELIDARYYKVAAGKFLRSWDKDLRENINFIQKSDVTKIYIPTHYGGDYQNQQNNLAILQLTTPFRLANSVRAVCFELNDERLDTLQTEAGRMGKVAGWGRTENGQPSEELKTLELPVIGYAECRKEMSKYYFSGYLTVDKLCAGHLNGSATCQGDSGGGLVFPAQDAEGNTRWYLRGVVSIAPLDDDKVLCRFDTYTAFTHIFKMGSWIKKTIGDVTRSISKF